MVGVDADQTTGEGVVAEVAVDRTELPGGPRHRPREAEADEHPGKAGARGLVDQQIDVTVARGQARRPPVPCPLTVQDLLALQVPRQLLGQRCGFGGPRLPEPGSAHAREAIRGRIG